MAKNILKSSSKNSLEQDGQNSTKFGPFEWSPLWHHIETPLSQNPDIVCAKILQRQEAEDSSGKSQFFGLQAVAQPS